jgi:hypothetical protein
MIRSLFTAYAATGISHAVRDSSWIFAFVEVLHLLSLAILGGTLLVGLLALAELGFSFDDRSAAWRGLRWTSVAGAVGLLLTGVGLAGVNPLKYYWDDAFRYKMLFLALALVALGVAFFKGAELESRLLRRLLALLTLGLWLATGVSGRAIGLL